MTSTPASAPLAALSSAIPQPFKVAVVMRALVAAIMVPFMLWWSGSGTLLAAFGGDNAIYFLTANYFSPYAEPLAVAGHIAASSSFPPLYPLVLALTGGGQSLAMAHLVTAVMLVLALVMAYRCGCVLGLSRNQAMMTLLLFASCRITLLQALETHSEHLYLLFALGACAALAHPPVRGNRLLLATLAVSAGYLTRTFGLTLVVSLLVWLVMHRPRHGWLYAATVLGVVGWWSGWHSGSAHYLANMETLYGDRGWFEQLTRNVNTLWPSWLGCFAEPGQAGFLPVLPAMLALFAAAGLALRLRAQSFDGSYVLAYLALMTVWPYGAEYQRMLYPLLPLLFAYAVLAATATARHMRPLRRLLTPLLGVVVLAAELPFVVLVLTRLLTPPADPGYAPYLHSQAWYFVDPATAFSALAYDRAITEALSDIRVHQRVPPGECLVAAKPSVVAAYSGIRVDGLPPFNADDADLLQTLRAGRCHYLFMTLAASPTFPQAYFPYHRLRQQLLPITVYLLPLAAPDQPAAVLMRLAPP